MAKGATAKVNVENKIREAFGADFVGNVDKKLYVWADDGGERVQICFSMTCPKIPVGVGSENNGIDFDNMPDGGTHTEFKPAEITDNELENIRELLRKTGF